MNRSTLRLSRQDAALVRYYQFHSRIYDATRWTFLFGRRGLLGAAADAVRSPRRVLEVGCGTGRNLVDVCRRFPDAEITGIDLSLGMLNIARRKMAPFGSRVQLLHRAYDAPVDRRGGAFDFILFSYALSMFNSGIESAVEAAHSDLAPDGHLAVVDFHDTRLSWFERWMGHNHVRMDGHLLPMLRARFEPETDRVFSAYGGAWRYFLFVGRRTGQRWSFAVGDKLVSYRQ